MNAFGTRRRFLAAALFALALLALLGVSAAQNVGASAVAVGPVRSGPLDMTSDGRLLLNVNPDAASVTVFNVQTDVPSKRREIFVGGDPTSVAIGRGNLTAFVTSSQAGTLSVINLQQMQLRRTLQVGVEPSAVAISPNGSRIYVANASSNNLVVLRAGDFATVATVDLSPFGTSPKAIAITNDGDGDDADETIFVALFYAQLRAGKTSVDEGQDDQREGRVVGISADTNTVLPGLDPVRLGPIASAGFNSNGRLAPGPAQVPAIPSTNPQTFTTPTGAFPNQLASVAIQPGQARAYVVSTGASPNGPLRFNSNSQGLVSLFDTATGAEITSGQTDPTFRRTAPLNMNQGVNLATTPAPRLFMSNPVALGWLPNGSEAWAVIQNGDLLVRMTVDPDGIPTVGAPLIAGPSEIVRLDLSSPPLGQIPGRAPRGILINGAGTRAYVSNYISRSVSVVDISNPLAPAVVGSARSTAVPAPNTIAGQALFGAELFFTGRGPQERMSSENWGGCIVCHPSGRSDNVTWMFDAGPRQTINLDAMFSSGGGALGVHQRILNWSAVRDENQDFELNTRGVFGGRGLIDDDRLFLAVGGISGTEPLQVEQFDQATSTVGTTNGLTGSTLPSLPEGRRNFGITTLTDDRIFIIGGRTGPTPGTLITGSSTVIEFNPRTNVGTFRSNLGFTPRHSLQAAAVRTSQGIRIYAIGGYTDTNPAAFPTALVQEYNPTTDTWRNVASLPQAVGEFGFAVAGGLNTADPRQLIHAQGGNVASGAAPLVTANVQRFLPDPAGPGVWTSFNVAGLTPRRHHGLATAIRGVAARLFVIGGMDGSGTVLDTVEEYTNATVPAAVMTPHTSLPAPRALFGVAASLSTNQIYVAGGLDGMGVSQTSILEYTIGNNGPVAGPPGTPSGTWVTRANLLGPRHCLQLSNPPGVTNFLPAKNSGRSAAQDSIAQFILRMVRTSRAPVPRTDPGAMAGRTLFGTTGLVVPGFSCATCHGGKGWTRSLVDYAPPPSPADNVGLGNQNIIGAELRKTTSQPGVFPGVLINVGTFTLAGGRVNEIRSNPADISQAIQPLGANGFNIPSLFSVHETRPYFYSGLAQTLDDVLNGSSDGNGGVRHHFVADPQQRADLVSFLRSIDRTTPIFP